MTQYILIAEIVIKNLEGRQQLKGEIFESIRPIILELKRQLKNSHLVMNSELGKKFVSNSTSVFQSSHIDFSLVPKISNKCEFTLWLASLVQKITIDTTKEKDIPLMIFPKLHQASKMRRGEKFNQITHSSSSKMNDDFCDAINDYFNQLKK